MEIIKFEEIDFPLESYLIGFREKARRRIKDSNSEDLLKILKQFSLIDTFLYRIKMDPGFFDYVCDEVYKDPYTLQLIYLFVYNKLHQTGKYGDEKIYNLSVNLDLSLDYYGITSTPDSWDVSRPRLPKMLIQKYSQAIANKNTDPEQFFSDIKKENEKFENCIDNPLDRIFFSLNLTNFLFKSFANINTIDQKNLFLKEQLEMAMNNNNEDRAYAVSSLIDEYKYNSFQINPLFCDHHIYVDVSNDYNEYWSYLSKKYLIEKVKFLDIYQYKLERYKSFNPLFNGLAWQTRLAIYDMISELKLLTDHPIKKTKKEDINDLMIVAGIIWFTSKNENEKLDILKTLHPFTHKLYKKNKINIVKMLGLEESSKYAVLLTESGYFDCAEYIYGELLNTYNVTNETRCAIILQRAAIAFEKGDESAFIKGLNNVLNFSLKNNGQANYDEMAISIYLDLAKTYKTSKPEKSQEYLKHAIDKVKNIPPERKYDSLFYIAKYYDDIHEYESSQKIYQELSHNINQLKNSKDYVQFRLKLFDDNKIENSNRLDIDNIHYIEKDNLYNIYTNKGSVAFYSLQLETAERWFQEASKIKEDSNIQGWFGIIQYYKGDYATAKSIFETIVKSGQEDISAYLYLSIISVITNVDDDSSVKYLEKSIDLSFKTGVDYHLYRYLLPDYFIKTTNSAYVSNIRMLVKELIFNNKMKIMLELLEKCESTISKHIHPAIYYLDIGSILTDFGFFKEGRDYYYKAMEKNPREVTLATILGNIGTNYANQNDHSNAILCYNQSLSHNSDNYMMWSNKAISLLHVGDFIPAYECITKSIGLFEKQYKTDGLSKVTLDHVEFVKDRLFRLEMKREMIKSFKDNFIKTGLIPNKDEAGNTIYSIIITAEKLLFRMGDKKLESFDYSMALVEYGKALESIMHYEITVKVLEQAKKDLPEELINYVETDSYDELYHSIRDVIRDHSRTISLGEWRNLKRNLEDSDNPISIQFITYINNRFSNKEWEIICKSCKSVSKYRNGSAHKDLKIRDDVLKVRGDIVNNINNVIDIIYKT